MMNNYQDGPKMDIPFSLQGILWGPLLESDCSTITWFLIAVRQGVKSKENLVVHVVQELELAILKYTNIKLPSLDGTYMNCLTVKSLFTSIACIYVGYNRLFSKRSIYLWHCLSVI